MQTLVNDLQWIKDVIEDGEGILQLAPTWVPRVFMIPGRRLRLATEDIYCLGTSRGGINERWFASTTQADNGPQTPHDEGLSYIVRGDSRMALDQAIKLDGQDILGQSIFDEYHRWMIYAKLFDNNGPIPLHLHQMIKHAANVGKEGKPEAYYFPPEMNPYEANFPYTFFGLLPGTTKDQVRSCLERWDKADNGILNLSQAYRLELNSGWLLPPGILHAPGSLCTFEVQWASDVFAFYQNIVEDRVCARALLVKDVPKDKWYDIDYLLDMIDWETNVDPHFHEHHNLQPVKARGSQEEGFFEYWIVYGKFDGKDLFSAKRLVVFPGSSCTLTDKGPYGVYVTNGYGTLGPYSISSPSMIYYGQIPQDEFFVSQPAAANGVLIKNTGSLPLTMLKFFGPDSSPDMPG